MSGVLIRTALLLFVPLIIALFTSEILGVDKKYTSSDALVQALAEVFRVPTAGRIVFAILWVCTLGISTFYWRQWVDDQMAPLTIQVPKPDARRACERSCAAPMSSKGGTSPDFHHRDTSGFASIASTVRKCRIRSCVASSSGWTDRARSTARIAH